MAASKLYNVVIAVTSPEDGHPQAIASLTALGQAGLALFDSVAGVSHMTDGELAKQMLRQAFNGLGNIVVNPPLPRETTKPALVKGDGSVAGEKHRGRGAHA